MVNFKASLKFEIQNHCYYCANRVFVYQLVNTKVIQSQVQNSKQLHYTEISTQEPSEIADVAESLNPEPSEQPQILCIALICISNEFCEDDTLAPVQRDLQSGIPLNTNIYVESNQGMFHPAQLKFVPNNPYMVQVFVSKIEQLSQDSVNPSLILFRVVFLTPIIQLKVITMLLKSSPNLVVQQSTDQSQTIKQNIFLNFKQIINVILNITSIALTLVIVHNIVLITIYASIRILAFLTITSTF
ncbi:hypothetical protein ABPG73_014446 [Tetrahymena malaccensis]